MVEGVCGRCGKELLSFVRTWFGELQYLFIGPEKEVMALCYMASEMCGKSDMVGLDI